MKKKRDEEKDVLEKVEQNLIHCSTDQTEKEQEAYLCSEKIARCRQVN